MNNDSFFDMLGEIDDNIISEAATLPEKKVKKKGEIKTFLLIAACLTALIVSGFILSDNIKTGNVSVYETSRENSVSDESILPYIEETTEATSSAEIASDEPTTDEASTQEISSSENTLTSLYIPENTQTTEKASEEESTEKKTTGNSILNIIPPFIEKLFPQGGDTAPTTDLKGYFFHEVSAISFLEILPTDSFDKNVYNNTESVSWQTLSDIYGTKIIPDITSSSENFAIEGISGYEIYNKKHTVHFNEDKTEVFASQEFSFTISSGILTVKISTDEFPLYSKEKEHKNSRSLINETPVLLISGKTLGKVTLYNALFEKNGVFFRITLKGADLNEEEFINIIRSLL